MKSKNFLILVILAIVSVTVAWLTRSMPQDPAPRTAIFLALLLVIL